MPFTYVPVVGSYVDSTGAPARGTVSFTPTYVMRNGSSTSRGAITVELEQDGSLPEGLELAATTDPATSPTGVNYRVVERILPAGAGSYVDREVTATYYIEVDHTAPSVDLAAEATDVQPDEPALYQRISEKGIAGGYAPLDGAGKVPVANLPGAALPVSDATQAALDALGLADLADVDTAGAAVGQLVAVGQEDPLGFELIDVDSTGVVAPPALIVPDGVVNATVSPATWPSANLVKFVRFALLAEGVYRYLNVDISAQSGNVQYGIVALSGAGGTSFTRVANSGIVPCPAVGRQRLDFDATTLPPGDYAAFFWADNITFSMRQASNSAAAALRVSGSQTEAGGLPASGTLGWGAEYFHCSVEADI